MLGFILEYDYAHFVKHVEKLGRMLEAKASEDEKLILDFFSSAKKTVENKLRTLENSSEYLHWCLSDNGQEIALFAKSLSESRQQRSSDVDVLIFQCAEELAYLISFKCASFYNED